MAYRGHPTEGQHSEGRLTGSRRGLTLAFLTVLAVTLLGGAPAMIVFGLISLGHAHQIRAHGVATTATVLSRDSDYNSQETTTCWGARVSYVTAAGAQEQSGLPDRGYCLTVGSSVRVVYDPAAPNVIQLASHRGDTSGGWSDVIMGGLFTLLFWGIAIWGFVKQRRWRLPADWRIPPVHGGRGTAAVTSREDA